VIAPTISPIFACRSITSNGVVAMTSASAATAGDMFDLVTLYRNSQTYVRSAQNVARKPSRKTTNTFCRSFWIDRRNAFADSRPSASDCWVSSSRALAIREWKSVAVINLFDPPREPRGRARLHPKRPIITRSRR